MKDLRVDTSGELVLMDNDFLIVEDETDLEQSLKLILTTRIGEFVLDENLGTLWDNLLGKEYNAEYLEQDIRNAILEQEDRIAEVTSVEQKVTGRSLTVVLNCITKTNEEIEAEVILDAE